MVFGRLNLTSFQELPPYGYGVDKKNPEEWVPLPPEFTLQAQNKKTSVASNVADDADTRAAETSAAYDILKNCEKKGDKLLSRCQCTGTGDPMGSVRCGKKTSWMPAMSFDIDRGTTAGKVTMQLPPLKSGKFPFGLELKILRKNHTDNCFPDKCAFENEKVAAISECRKDKLMFQCKCDEDGKEQLYIGCKTNPMLPKLGGIPCMESHINRGVTANDLGHMSCTLRDPKTGKEKIHTISYKLKEDRAPIRIEDRCGPCKELWQRPLPQNEVPLNETGGKAAPETTTPEDLANIENCPNNSTVLTCKCDKDMKRVVTARCIKKGRTTDEIQCDTKSSHTYIKRGSKDDEKEIGCEIKTRKKCYTPDPEECIDATRIITHKQDPKHKKAQLIDMCGACTGNKKKNVDQEKEAYLINKTKHDLKKKLTPPPPIDPEVIAAQANSIQESSIIPTSWFTFL